MSFLGAAVRRAMGGLISRLYGIKLYARTHWCSGYRFRSIVESQPQLKIQLINGQFLCVSSNTYYLA